MNHRPGSFSAAKMLSHASGVQRHNQPKLIIIQNTQRTTTWKLSKYSSNLLLSQCPSTVTLTRNLAPVYVDLEVSYVFLLSTSSPKIIIRGVSQTMLWGNHSLSGHVNVGEFYRWARFDAVHWACHRWALIPKPAGEFAHLEHRVLCEAFTTAWYHRYEAARKPELCRMMHQRSDKDIHVYTCMPPERTITLRIHESWLGLAL